MGRRSNSVMGVRRKTLLLGFAVALLFGTAIYFRLWAIDSSFTVDDREELRLILIRNHVWNVFIIHRRQFDRANMEAMDESASWRMKFDEELDKSRMFQDELLKVKAALANANERLVILRKENSSLQKKLEMLTHSKEQCNCSNSSTLHR